MEQLVILVFYINLHDGGNSKIAKERYEQFNREVNASSWPEGYTIKPIVIPIKGKQDASVECIYPKDATENAAILEKITKFTNIIEKWNGKQ